MLTLNNPTPLLTLLEDDDYRAYLKRVPRLPAGVNPNGAWQVWALTVRDTWATKRFDTYRDALGKALELARDLDNYVDASVTCRGALFKAPSVLATPTWCGRCRRPSVFRAFPRHHALKDARAGGYWTEESRTAKRCYYCGVRRDL